MHGLTLNYELLYSGIPLLLIFAKHLRIREDSYLFYFIKFRQDLKKENQEFTYYKIIIK
jgi:hypothetical protein